MNKQRLLELAGITEAKHTSQTSTHWAVVTYDYGNEEFFVVAPFNTKQEAEKYVEWEIGEFDLEDEHVGKVVQIEPPQW